MNILILGESNYINSTVLPSLDDEPHMVDVYNWDYEFGPELLNSEILSSYDCILVAHTDKTIGDDLCTLIKKLISSNDSCHVINFYRYRSLHLSNMRVDKAMTNPRYPYYDGMVLGISHAEVGILANRLPGNCCNLAISSQDLYYNFKNLCHCISNYGSKVSNLKYIVLDMFDYNYFNYDVSQTRDIYIYWAIGGYILDEHNITKNKNYKGGAEVYKLWRLKDIIPDIDMSTLELFNSLFPNIYESTNYEELGNFSSIEKRIRCVTKDELDNYEFKSSILSKEFPETIDENIAIFDKMLSLIYSTWPGIQVYVTLLPLPEIILERRSDIMRKWESQFNSVIETMQQKYNFHYISYLHDEMSHELSYFYDWNHLNYLGAFEFTKKLSNLIKNMETL